jgi:TonB family protein
MNRTLKIVFVFFSLLFLIIGCGGSKEEGKVTVIGGNDVVRFTFKPTISAEYFYSNNNTLSFKHSTMIENKDAFLAKIKYPDYAVKNGIEGLVEIDFIVNEVGLVDGIKLVNSIGGGCEGTFIEELKKQKFKPATLNNKPVSEWISVKVKFSLI